MEYDYIPPGEPIPFANETMQLVVGPGLYYDVMRPKMGITRNEQIFELLYGEGEGAIPMFGDDELVRRMRLAQSNFLTGAAWWIDPEINGYANENGFVPDAIKKYTPADVIKYGPWAETRSLLAVNCTGDALPDYGLANLRLMLDMIRASVDVELQQNALRFVLLQRAYAEQLKTPMMMVRGTVLVDIATLTDADMYNTKKVHEIFRSMFDLRGAPENTAPLEQSQMFREQRLDKRLPVPKFIDVRVGDED